MVRCLSLKLEVTQPNCSVMPQNSPVHIHTCSNDLKTAHVLSFSLSIFVYVSLYVGHCVHVHMSVFVYKIHIRSIVKIISLMVGEKIPHSDAMCMFFGTGIILREGEGPAWVRREIFCILWLLSTYPM